MAFHRPPPTSVEPKQMVQLRTLVRGKALDRLAEDQARKDNGVVRHRGAQLLMVQSHPATLLAFSYHAVLGQALATVLWFEVVTKIPASTAALGTLTVPAVGVASAMLILGERPSIADHIGLALIMAAASTVLLPNRRADATREART
jgi:hypothetical protein